MKINIYYGGRGLLDDPTLYVISKMEDVLRELRVKVERYNIYERKNEIATLPQTIKDADGIITLLYTDPLDREIDNRFKSFVEKTLGKKIEDVKIINVDNQLFEQCSNNVNMNSLLALTAIRDGGILDMQRESILNEQNQSSEQSWVGRLCESQQKTHSRENSF